jgi:hypothetical protein
MVRCWMNFKRFSLIDIKINIKRVPKNTTLIKVLEEAGNDEAYSVDPFSTIALYSYSRLKMISHKRIVIVDPTSGEK